MGNYEKQWETMRNNGKLCMGNYVWETMGFQDIPLFQMKEEILQG